MLKTGAVEKRSATPVLTVGGNPESAVSNADDVISDWECDLPDDCDTPMIKPTPSLGESSQSERQSSIEDVIGGTVMTRTQVALKNSDENSLCGGSHVKVVCSQHLTTKGEGLEMALPSKEEAGLVHLKDESATPCVKTATEAVIPTVEDGIVYMKDEAPSPSLKPANQDEGSSAATPATMFTGEDNINEMVRLKDKAANRSVKAPSVKPATQKEDSGDAEVSIIPTGEDDPTGVVHIKDEITNQSLKPASQDEGYGIVELTTIPVQDHLETEVCDLNCGKNTKIVIEVVPVKCEAGDSDATETGDDYLHGIVDVKTEVGTPTKDDPNLRASPGASTVKVTQEKSTDYAVQASTSGIDPGSDHVQQTTSNTSSPTGSSHPTKQGMSFKYMGSFDFQPDSEAIQTLAKSIAEQHKTSFTIMSADFLASPKAKSLQRARTVSSCTTDYSDCDTSLSKDFPLSVNSCQMLKNTKEGVVESDTVKPEPDVVVEPENTSHQLAGRLQSINTDISNRSVSLDRMMDPSDSSLASPRKHTLQPGKKKVMSKRRRKVVKPEDRTSSSSDEEPLITVRDRLLRSSKSSPTKDTMKKSDKTASSENMEVDVQHLSQPLPCPSPSASVASSGYVGDCFLHLQKFIIYRIFKNYVFCRCVSANQHNIDPSQPLQYEGTVLSNYYTAQILYMLPM